MPLNALPNEILLRILKAMYPPGTFQAPYGFTDGILSLPPSSSRERALFPSECAAKKQEYDGYRQFFAALKNADMAVQNMATMNQNFRSLSRCILVLRAASKELLPVLSQLKLEEVTWEKLALALSEFDLLLDQRMERLEFYLDIYQEGVSEVQRMLGW